MTEITVVFTDGNSTPIVTHDNEAVLEGRIVAWNVHAPEGSDITGVRIRFDGGATYFNDKQGDPTHELERPLSKYPGSSKRAMIWGIPPTVDDPSGRREDSYSITAVTDGGSGVPLDPKIITIKP
jgi:hypothetical protein